MAVELTGKNVANWGKEELPKWAGENLDYLVTSRPTGVNLKIECASLKGEKSPYLREAIKERPKDFMSKFLQGQD